MIAEIGLFSLIIALLFAMLLVMVPSYGLYHNKALCIQAAPMYVWGISVFTALSFFCLTLCFILDDFTVIYVLAHSSTSLPWFYKCCAVWGGHEGSMLLWLLILCLWTTAVSVFSQTLPEVLRTRVLIVLGLLCIGFICFILMTSNPFLRQFDWINTQGNDLNPMLQDLGFLFHPPMLYMGYVGFSVPFSFAMAILWLGKLESSWVKWIRPWTLIAWCALTLGITLGSWWAYRELGWGGFWFWDPVENASFMPWLVGTALIHALMVAQKRDVLLIATLFLAIVAFALSLIGTFLVRSGVLTSVHAFAVDPTRGLYILGLLTVTIGGALMLFSLRLGQFHKPQALMFWSRESLIFLSQVFLFVAMLTVLLGTVYPLLIDGLGLGKLSVGMPYFNTVFIPLILPVLLLMGIGIHARWQQENGLRLMQLLWGCAFLSVGLMGVIFLLARHRQSFLLMISELMALWVLVTTCYGFYFQLKRKHFRAPGLGYTGMTIAHLGIFVTVMGVAVSTGYGSEQEVKLAPGETYHTHDYQLTFVREASLQGENYRGIRGIYRYVTRHSHAIIKPEKRIYEVGQRTMTEAAIDISPLRDVYIAMGERFDDGAWSVRIYIKPLVRWIWFGGLMMVFGGFLAFIKRSRQ
jgi:cytochrome c-type biogenesis protein CcmF